MNNKIMPILLRCLILLGGSCGFFYAGRSFPADEEIEAAEKRDLLRAMIEYDPKSADEHTLELFIEWELTITRDIALFSDPPLLQLFLNSDLRLLNHIEKKSNQDDDSVDYVDPSEVEVMRQLIDSIKKKSVIVNKNKTDGEGRSQN